MKKLFLLIATLSACLCVSAATYTNDDVDEAIRKSLDYSCLISHLPETANYTTPSLVQGVLTKMLVTTTAEKLKDFAIIDTGGGDNRYQYQGDEIRAFKIDIVMGVTASAPNIIFKLGVYQNDAGFIPGVVGEVFRGPGEDAGQFSLNGYVVLQPLDTISFWAKLITASTTTLTFENMSIVITELN